MNWLFLSLLLLAGAARADEPDCGMCHDSPPVPASHPPVRATGPAACFSCHATQADDPLFLSLHVNHPDLGMDCQSCHETKDPDALSSRLKHLFRQ